MKRLLVTLISTSSIFLLLVADLSSSPVMAKRTASLNKYRIEKVLLIVAMDNEAKPIISALHLHKMTRKLSDLPMQEYVGKYRNLDILLVTNGLDPVNHVQNVGTQAATLSTYVGIEYFHPDLIVNIGTAGGVKENGAKLKEIYVSKKIYFYDRRITSKGYHEYGLGGYESADISPIDKKIGLKPGIICSGDSFDDNQTDYNMFIKLHCSAVDMEAAGAAWVSMLMKTPLISIKGITNFVKGADIHKQFHSNFSTVTLTLSKKLEALLKNISEK